MVNVYIVSAFIAWLYLGWYDCVYICVIIFLLLYANIKQVLFAV